MVGKKRTQKRRLLREDYFKLCNFTVSFSNGPSTKLLSIYSNYWMALKNFLSCSAFAHMLLKTSPYRFLTFIKSFKFFMKVHRKLLSPSMVYLYTNKKYLKMNSVLSRFSVSVLLLAFNDENAYHFIFNLIQYQKIWTFHASNLNHHNNDIILANFLLF